MVVPQPAGKARRVTVCSVYQNMRWWTRDKGSEIRKRHSNCPQTRPHGWVGNGQKVRWDAKRQNIRDWKEGSGYRVTGRTSHRCMERKQSRNKPKQLQPSHGGQFPAWWERQGVKSGMAIESPAVVELEKEMWLVPWSPVEQKQMETEGLRSWHQWSFWSHWIFIIFFIFLSCHQKHLFRFITETSFVQLLSVSRFLFRGVPLDNYGHQQDKGV